MAALHGSDRGGEHAPASPERAPEKPTGGAALSPLVVERITHQDVPAICTLYRRVWEHGSSGGLPTELVKSWQPTPLEFTSWMEGVTYFAARRDGRLLGVIGCEIDHGNCHLVSLAVDPDGRRKGVGSALVAAGIEWARHANAGQVWADALARLTAVSALFKHLGFAECGVLHRHNFNEDVRLFERTL
ncbi:MAG: GNAT family N-acetyltransferase [Thermoplasmata archaeon]